MGEAQTTAENLADLPQEYGVLLIVSHSNTSGEVKYFVRCYGYTLADNTAEPPEQIPEHFNSHCWLRERNNDAVQRQRKGTYLYKEREYQGSGHWLDGSEVYDGISSTHHFFARRQCRISEITNGKWELRSIFALVAWQCTIGKLIAAYSTFRHAFSGMTLNHRRCAQCFVQNDLILHLLSISWPIENWNDL